MTVTAGDLQPNDKILGPESFRGNTVLRVEAAPLDRWVVFIEGHPRLASVRATKKLWFEVERA